MRNYENFGGTPAKPEPRQPEKIYSPLEEEARGLETELRNKAATAARLAADARTVELVVQLSLERYELSSRSAEEGQNKAAAETLRSITENRNFQRSLETSAQAAETARLELEKEIRRLRQIDAHFDKLIAEKLKNLRPEDLH